MLTANTSPDEVLDVQSRCTLSRHSVSLVVALELLGIVFRDDIRNLLYIAEQPF